MAFKPKKDRCGIISATTPSGGTSPYNIRDAQRNGSLPSEIYQEERQCGEVDFDTYGEDGQPSNTYAVAGGEHDIPAGAVKLAAIVTVTEKDGDPQADPPVPAVVKNYGLASYGHGTQTSNPVTVNAAAQLLEDDVTDRQDLQAFWPLPAHHVSSHQCPQDVYGAFTLSGKGCSLRSVNDNAQVQINPDKLVGRIISTDSNTAYISVTGQILKSIKIPGAEDPVITPNPNDVILDAERGLKSKWVLIKAPAPSENNPETEAPTYDFELRLPLKKVKPWEEDESSSAV